MVNIVLHRIQEKCSCVVIELFSPSLEPSKLSLYPQFYSTQFHPISRLPLANPCLPPTSPAQKLGHGSSWIVSPSSGMVSTSIQEVAELGLDYLNSYSVMKTWKSNTWLCGNIGHWKTFIGCPLHGGSSFGEPTYVEVGEMKSKIWSSAWKDTRLFILT